MGIIINKVLICIVRNKKFVLSLKYMSYIFLEKGDDYTKEDKF